MTQPDEKPLPIHPKPAPETLTPEQTAKAYEWLTTRWKQFVCQFHGPTNWQLDNSLGYLPARAAMLGGPVYPVLVLTCQECGHIVFVSAIQAGVIERDEEMKPTESQVGS